MKQICAVKNDDGIVFKAPEITAEEVRAGAKYEGVRVRILASLDKARTSLQIDVGFGDVVNPAVEDRELPTIVALEPPRLRTYPLETVIAEKFQAMVHLDVANSRMKDFFDVWLLCQEHAFKMSRVAGAIRATFKHRNTEMPSRHPTALTDRFLKDEKKAVLWREFLNRAGLPPSLGELHEIGSAIAAFLMPIVEHIRSAGKEEASWLPKGPWGNLRTVVNDFPRSC
jgi:hypothetical protein